MNVDERLRILKRAETNARATPCGTCGHPYREHVRDVRCYATRCRCKAFVDPVDEREGVA